MSLQRIFESARKLGVPVIVTDPSGRDPLVVMPLDQFEAMTGENQPKSEIRNPKSQTPVRLAEARQVPPSGEPLSAFEGFASGMVENDEIPLEERFFLEPLDDEK